jgi:S1-C subfamily serine protease
MNRDVVLGSYPREAVVSNRIPQRRVAKNPSMSDRRLMRFRHVRASLVGSGSTMSRASDVRPSPMWLAAATALVGVSLGAAAVMLGLRTGARQQRELAAAQASGPEECASPAAAEVLPPAVPLVSAPSGLLVEAVAATRDAVVNVATGRTLGAGVIVDPQGIVVTNYHVIADALEVPVGLRPDASRSPTVTARFEDGRELPATVLVADGEEDLAILRLQPPDPRERFAAVSLGRSSALAVGQEVFAIGNPLGLNHSVSRGIVAALDRTEVLRDRKLPLVQLDAAINVGNSGGPLFALDGSLVGIVTLRRKDALGIAFAVPVDHVRGFLRAVSDPEAPRRSGAIGVEIRARRATGPDDRQAGHGAWLEITQVLADGPAAAAGLRVGDRVVEVRGKRLDGLPGADEAALAMHLAATVRSLFPGERLPLTVVRGDAVEHLEVEVGAAPSDRQVAIDAEELLGLRLRPGEAVIVGALPGTPFAGLARPLDGVQIVRLLDRTITSVEDLGTGLAQLRELLRGSHGPLEVLVGLREGDGSGATGVYLVLVE